MTKPLTRRPPFWALFGALAIAGVATAVTLFDEALPNVSLDISMDREGAMGEALVLAQRYGWGPDGARSAASFGQVDPEVQTYVELEGGGRDAFQGLMDAGVYQPYQWRVRRFAEGEVTEAEVRFTPSGEAYGFRLRLGEADPGGGNLGEAEARAVAEAAAPDWRVDLGAYRLLESSEETLTGGRVDHTFVYERDQPTLAEARFRLELVVAGDRLAGLTHFVFVPEAFSRRYADMRSTNDAIALVAQAIFVLVYVLLGAGIGSALLLRGRWIEWRTAMVWGGVVALLFGLNAINALPLAWMGYDTALSARTFVLQNLASAGAIAVLGTPLLGFFFLAGESLGRKGFPGHLQQWKFWSPEVASSNTALGLTVAAYLFVGVQLGYVVLFYLGTGRLEGWWSPADALVQPDLLATYMPWLQAVSVSMFAAFWEESIFRAVPIACAALIGTRYGNRNAWIWGAVAVQAVVFAAGHANYPQQPPYARVVELTLPALAWGVVYVLYGLVPTILAHFVYNLSLISSVLFASDALGDQLVIVAVGLAPLAVVLWHRRGGRARSTAPDWAMNAAWRPPSTGAPSQEPSAGAPDAAAEAPPADAPTREGELATRPTPPAAPEAAEVGTHGWALPLPRSAFRAMGVAGLLLWLTSILVDEAPTRLSLTRTGAEAAARAALAAQGFELSGWTASFVADGARAQAHEYVFEEAGEAAFEELLGDFLAPPQWVVRFVDWQAPPEERAEEFVVNLGADGSVRRIAHTLPEGRLGARLAEDSARVLARAALPSADWVEVGAEETTHDARTDWDFTFRAAGVLSEVAAEARASVTVAGEEVSNVRRFVDVPEEWERSEREADTRRTMVFVGMGFMLFVLFGAAAITAVVVWSRAGLATAPVWKAGALTLVAMGLGGLNSWPSTSSIFVTAQPYGFQAGGAAFGLVLVTLVGAAAVGLVVALGHSWSAKAARAAVPSEVGIAVGLLVAGVGSLSSGLSQGMPPLPDYSGAAALAAALSAPLGALPPFLALGGGVLALSAAHLRFRDRPVLRSVTGFAILAMGAVVAPPGLRDSTLLWALGGLGGAAVIWGLVRLVASAAPLAPLVFGTMVVLTALEGMLDAPYPGSVVGQALTVVLVVAVALLWARELSVPDQAAERSLASVGSE